MKFEIGDETDKLHCMALRHEFLRCDDALILFNKYKSIALIHGRNRALSIRCYNAYASFTQSLYEFYYGCCAREQRDTEVCKDNRSRTAIIDSYMSHHARRVLDSLQPDIEVSAPPHHLTEESEALVESFPEELRRARNKCAVHADHKRVKSISLAQFYNRYNHLMQLLHSDAKSWWSSQEIPFPDLHEITDFMVLIEKRNT